MVIRQDNVSKFLLAVAAMATIFLATFETTTVVLFPVILLVTGLSMEYLLERRKPEEDYEIDDKERTQISVYTILAILAMFATGFFVDWSFDIPTQSITFVSVGFNAIAYTTLIAIAEEQFFRGFITDGLIMLCRRIPILGSTPFFPITFSAAIFCGYHFSRYGTSPDSLVYVYIGGFILSYIAYRTKRLSPTMFAHVFNNIASITLKMV